MIEIIAPTTQKSNNNYSIFLAGTIDNGSSEDWQLKFIEHIKQEYASFDINIYNPRRDFVHIEQMSPDFFEQVEWELSHLDKCDIIIMNLLKNSISPISLLELGLYAREKKMFIVCDEEFWRRGNVIAVAKKYNIPLYNSIGEMLFDLDIVIKKDVLH